RPVRATLGGGRAVSTFVAAASSGRTAPGAGMTAGGGASADAAAAGSASSRAATSAAVCTRSAGSLARSCMISASSDGSTRPGAALGERLRQRAPGEELHGEVELAVVGLAVVVDADGVRVLDLRGRLHLAIEAPGGVGVLGDGGVDDLERDHAVHRDLACLV